MLKRTESGIKGSITPGGFFEELGIRYIGPVDGHNIEELIKIFKALKEIKGPILLHVYTNKSRRIKHFATSDAIKYYSLSAPNVGNEPKKITFSQVFGKSIVSIAKDYKFICITAAMKIGTGLEEFSKKYKNRYIDVAIAEQHALTYASGLSASGTIPIVAIYSTFIQRAYDQIIHDIAIQNLPVVICMDRAGLVGPDGPTHHGIFDISFLRIIPNIIVTSPKDGDELHDLLFTAIQAKKIISIRYGKISTKYKTDYTPKVLEIGSWEEICQGDDIAILAVGSMVETAIKVSNLFKSNENQNIGVFNCRFIKPLDENKLNFIGSHYSTIYTIEEGSIAGGFGSSVSEFFSRSNFSNLQINLLGVPDEFIDHGSREKLLDLVGLSTNKIYERIKNER
jgi:1-deoxy-D-xylulose-5-phosphate synthase